MTTRTMTPGAISYVVRRARTVLRQVDTDAALFGTALGTEPLDAATRHSGTDVVDGAVGAYSIRHGDADEASERQYRESQRKTLQVPGGRQGDIRHGTLAHLPTYLPRHSYVRHLPPMVARPGAFRGVWTLAGSHGGRRHVNKSGEALTGAERTYLSRQRSAARKSNPDATPAQIEAVAWSALEAKREREAKPQATVTEDTVTVSVDALAVAADRGW